MDKLIFSYRPSIFAFFIGAAVFGCSFMSVHGEPFRSGQGPFPDTSKVSAPVFPDEFTDLDEGRTGVSINRFGDEVAGKLESARQKYLKALTLVEKSDTVLAAEQFELAITILNELASTPGIEQNDDFTDLVQSIIEDYESYVQSIDNLDVNSSVFVLRDRLFEEVDAARPVVEIIAVPNVTPVTIPAKTTIDLTYNEFVEKNITFLAGDRGRKFMRKWLERTGRWFDILKRVAKEEDMPEEIIYLAMMESGLNPNAVSRAKAVGMWQFIQSTGEQYNLETSFWIDERRDVEKATRSAMHFLKDLYRELGDWHLALAAYNCGGGGVRRAIRKSGGTATTFWEARDFLPRETKNYVPLYIATALITMNREAYGFTADSVSYQLPLYVDKFAISEAVNLSALATCADISVDSLKVLNPELMRSCTPPSRKYELKIPGGTKEAFTRRYATLSDDAKRPWMTHKVARGETLASIARRYGASASEIAGINGLKGYQSRLRRGASLRIPVGAQESNIADNSETSSSSNSTANNSTRSNSTTSNSTGSNSTANNSTRSNSTTSNSTGSNSTANSSTGSNSTGSNSTANSSTGSNSTGSNSTGSNSTANSSTGSNSTGSNSTANSSTGSNSTGSNSTANSSTGSNSTGSNSTADNSTGSNSTESNSTGSSSVASNKTNSNASANTITTTKAQVVHVVVSGDNLTTIARRYGVRIADLRNWNDMPYDRENIQIGQSLVVAVVDRPSSAAKVERLTVERIVEHKVTKGESLASIAALYGTDVESLREINNMTSRSVLKAGKAIKVETKLTKSELAAIQRSAPTGKPLTHKVKTGESLGSIAALYSVEELDLKRWNADVVEGTTVFSGTRLKVYAPATQKGSSASNSAKKLPKTYKIRRGDTLSTIADKFGVSIDDIRRKNPSLRNSDVVISGQRIRLQ